MKPIHYFGIDACKKYGFPYIYAELTATEAAPLYENEADGLAELDKVLSFVQVDDYYPTFEEKSAYLLCGLAGSQYFSNGNKRLGVVVLLMFLQRNNVTVSDQEDALKEILQRTFPWHVWEENPAIHGAHSLFLYNLAIVIGDRTRWGMDSLKDVQMRVSEIFKNIHARE